ncbi:ATPase [Sulfuricaulis limicola]|uniref:ATPase n=1 Tax=Sulfuricaulis limicola TaxID=1620215 RepID=A0A1B4XGY9_9GAMM|nr:AAA family ATPase [Sulfuricaulis limicola]BAV34029.1 ATPase [Sulfuricaulis limicola]
MYLEYFKLKELPFRLTPDSEFLYMSGAHSRAKAYMDYSVWNREGFVVITGEIGCGKTTLIQKLLSELDENVLVAKIFQTQLDEVEFLQAVLVEFGLNPFNAKKVELIDMLNTFLIDNYLQLKQLVLIVDDAHNLSLKVLEEIRMLSGLETRKEKVLHVILVGQPALSEMLDTPEMEQLVQRVRLRYHIKSLSETDMRDYIHHRLRIAGAADPEGLFSQDTFPVMYKYTGGLPRLINTLCDTAMTVAFADNVRSISLSVLNSAIEELQWLPYAKRVNKRRAGIGAPGRAEMEALLHENTQALVNLDRQFHRMDSMAPALTSLTSRLSNIESHLKRIADFLDSTQFDAEAVRKKYIKQEK